MMLDHALKYAERGWYVFPLYPINDDGSCSCNKTGCKSPGKCPIVRWGKGKTSSCRCRSLKAYKATTDARLIKTWWKQWPDAGIGVACGPSNLICFDIDGRDGKQSLKEFKMIETCEARTGSGGTHYIYEGERRSRNGIRGGIDIKGQGGYFVAAPSLHKRGNRYTWKNKLKPAKAPKWLLELQALKIVQRCTKIENKNIGDFDAKALDYIDPDEGYDTWLKIGMALHSIGAYALFVKWSRRSKDFDEAEIIQKWSSFGESGITEDSIYYLARLGGYDGLEEEQEGTITVVSRPDFTAMVDKLKQRSYEPPNGFLKTIYDYTLRTSRRRQPLVALSAALMVCATAMGRVYRTEGGSRSNLYLVNVLEPGAGKDHGRSVINDILREAGMVDTIAGGAKSGSAVCMTLLGAPLQVYRIDEFGMLLQRASAEGPRSNYYDLLETLMKLYTSSHTIYQVDHYADQKRRPNREILYPCVNLLGSSAPASFYPALNSGSVASGFLSRFLILAAEGCPPKNKKRVEESVPKKVIKWIKELRDGDKNSNILGKVGDNPIIIFQCPEACNLFEAFDLECDQRANDDKNHITKILWRRAAEMADKIALICGGAGELKIEKHHMVWSINLVRWRTEWLINHLKTTGADTEYEGAKKRAYAAINAKRDKGISLKTIGQWAPFTGWPRRFRDEIVRDLIESEKVFKVFGISKGRGRKPAVLVSAEFVKGKKRT